MKRQGLIIVMATFLSAVGYAGDDAVKNDLKSLQGAWTYISLERAGKQSLAEDAQKLTFTVKDSSFLLKSGDRVLGPGELKIDPTKTPKTIDVLPTSGANKGKTLLGIYQLDGDTLKTCIAQPGEPRPQDFTALPSSDHTLGVLKRKKS